MANTPNLIYVAFLQNHCAELKQTICTKMKLAEQVGAKWLLWPTRALKRLVKAVGGVRLDTAAFT